MKFDFFKSDEDLLNKFQYIYTRLDKILEQQRYLLQLIIGLDKTLKREATLQKQVDDFYGDSDTNNNDSTEPSEELPSNQAGL